jgi:uncharacterized membrane protein
MSKKYTFSERQTDKLAAYMGSWTFIWQMSVVLIIYFLINIYAYFAWDKFPFIFLNLGFSAFACYQVPIILMAQNRQASLDSSRDNMDFKIDKMTHKQVKELHDKLDILLDRTEE